VVLILGSAMTLARFSEAFLVLRVQSLGLSTRFVPIVLVVMGVTYALSAYPAGILSDRVRRQWVLAVGLVFLIIADVTLALAASPLVALVGVGFWGLHLGFSQGIMSSMVADVSPKDLRGTAFGLFSLWTGLMLLVASVLAGLLWDRAGHAQTFWVGGVFAVIALLSLTNFPSRASD
jgi:MFS family permease